MYKLQYTGRHMIHLNGKAISRDQIIEADELPENMTFFRILEQSEAVKKTTRGSKK